MKTAQNLVRVEETKKVKNMKKFVVHFERDEISNANIIVCARNPV